MSKRSGRKDRSNRTARAAEPTSGGGDDTPAKDNNVPEEPGATGKGGEKRQVDGEDKDAEEAEDAGDGEGGRSEAGEGRDEDRDGGPGKSEAEADSDGDWEGEEGTRLRVSARSGGGGGEGLRRSSRAAATQPAEKAPARSTRHAEKAAAEKEREKDRGKQQQGGEEKDKDKEDGQGGEMLLLGGPVVDKWWVAGTRVGWQEGEWGRLQAGSAALRATCCMRGGTLVLKVS